MRAVYTDPSYPLFHSMKLDLKCRGSGTLILIFIVAVAVVAAVAFVVVQKNNLSIQNQTSP